MADENYTNVLVYLDDALLAQATRVRVRRSSGSSQVATMALGYAGESPGVSMCEIDVSNAMPINDIEFDPGTFIETLKRSKITLYASGKKLSSRGQIHEDSVEYAVNSPANLDFSFRGKFGRWEGV